MKNTKHIWTDLDLKKDLYDVAESQDKLTVFAAEEWAIDGDFDAERMKTKNVDWVFGAAEIYTLENTHKVGRVHLWWNFFLFKAVESLHVSHLDIANTNYEKVFITLNNLGHYHRCVLIDIIYKKDMQNLGYISWHNKSIDGRYTFKYFKPKTKIIDMEFCKNQTQNIPPKKYEKAFVNLVSESTIDIVFITEKTWHAILCEKCFLVQAAPGFHKILENKGFLLYDEIFDYAFDSEPDVEKRTDMLLEQINNLRHKDLKIIHNTILPKIIKNKKLALDMIKNQTDVPEICKEFKYYNNILEESKCRLDLLE